MKTKNVEKLKMFNSLVSLMDGNKAIWLRVKEIERAYKAFLEETNKLNLLNDDFEKGLENLIDKKADSRKNLILETLPISNLIAAFAIENKSKKLVKKCSLTRTRLKELKVMDLIEKSKEIWKEAKDLYNKSIAAPDSLKAKEKEKNVNIHNYGLTGQMIDKLELANVALIESHLELKDAYDHKKKCLKKIASGIKSNSFLLKNKLDLLISIFRNSDIDFYKKYLEVRMLHKDTKKKDNKSKSTKDKKKVENKKVETKIDKEITTVKNIPVIKPKTPAKNTPVKKPVVTKTEVSKTLVKKPLVSKTIASKTPAKRPVRRKPVPKPKAPEVKKEATESVKDM